MVGLHDAGVVTVKLFNVGAAGAVVVGGRVDRAAVIAVPCCVDAVRTVVDTATVVGGPGTAVVGATVVAGAVVVVLAGCVVVAAIEVIGAGSLVGESEPHATANTISESATTIRRIAEN